MAITTQKTKLLQEATGIRCWRVYPVAKKLSVNIHEVGLCREKIDCGTAKSQINLGSDPEYILDIAVDIVTLPS